MKKNLSLAGILVVLLVLTYFFQEKNSEKEFYESQTRNRVITEEIRQVKTGRFEAEKKSNQWWHDDQLLSANTFNQIIRKLQQVKLIRKIEEGERENYFSNPFHFEVNGEAFSIGDLTLDQQAFYLSRNDELMIAVVEGESMELTQDERSIPRIKLEELKNFLSKSLEELKENQLFRFYPDLAFSEVVIEADGNPKYTLDFKNNTTMPNPIAGVSSHQGLLEKFYSLITQMTLNEEIPYKNEFAKKLGQMTFELKEKKSLIWELWLKKEDSADAIILDHMNKRAFSMKGGTLKGFFIHVQDYWDKKVIPRKDFKSFSRLKVSFSQNDKTDTVTIINQEPLKFEAKKYKADGEKLELLFKYIFNLAEKDQADRVSNLSKTDKQQMLNDVPLRLELMGQELLLWQKAEELIVANLSQGFKAHFGLSKENFSVQFEDMLK